MNATAQAILNVLNREKVRATYGAVGEILGIPAWSVGQALGAKRSEASWVVNARTNMPTDYAPDQLHADLFRSAVIKTGAQLRQFLVTMPDDGLPATRH
jgi:alkylated DNA nucleotide flippase Atl1